MYYQYIRTVFLDDPKIPQALCQVDRWDIHPGGVPDDDGTGVLHIHVFNHRLLMVFLQVSVSLFQSFRYLWRRLF